MERTDKDNDNDSDNNENENEKRGRKSQLSKQLSQLSQISDNLQDIFERDCDLMMNYVQIWILTKQMIQE